MPAMEADTSNGGKTLDTANTKWNVLHAYVNFVLYHAALTKIMAIPTATYKAAFNVQAKAEGNKWLWEYNITSGDNHNCKLYGWADNGKVNWEMYVSKTSGLGQYENFLWYKGTHDVAGTAGNWMIYKSAQEPSKQVLQIDWSKTGQPGDYDIKYTGVEEGNPGKGGFIHYGVSSTNEYTNYYNIFNAEEPRTVNIEINKNTDAGRVKDSIKWPDGNWRCWTPAGFDSDCN
jgi:hypothetical protein